jgi:uncharacterized protein (TIGR02231 family)
MGFDFGFRAQQPTTIPSDGQVHRVPLEVHTLPARTEHVVIAALDEAAYVQASVEHGGPFPMLAGMSDVFVDGGYLGRVGTQTTPAGKELELGLGIDRQVKVKRRQEELMDEGGFVGNQKVRVFQISVELDNHHAYPIHVVLHDRAATAWDEGIKVDVDEDSLKQARTEEPNLFTWELDVAPGKKETVSFRYTVRHNKNLQVWHP